MNGKILSLISTVMCVLFLGSVVQALESELDEQMMNRELLVRPGVSDFGFSFKTFALCTEEMIRGFLGSDRTVTITQGLSGKILMVAPGTSDIEFDFTLVGSEFILMTEFRVESQRSRELSDKTGVVISLVGDCSLL